MFFSYTYINHNISQLQEWANFTFVNVWCNAKKEIEYNFELFDECIEFKNILMKEEYKTDPKVREVDYITGPVRAIYEEFQKLNASQKRDLKRLYTNGMHLDKICSNAPNYKPFSIYQISKHSEKLAKLLKSFYSNLYYKGLDLAVIENQNGNLEKHYEEFVTNNDRGICPFCGIEGFRSYAMKGHEAYDHYFPKEKYPFYSVYFKNLVLTCHSCNSVHKKRQIPTYKEINTNNSKVILKRRKAYYPYGLFFNKIYIKIKVDFIDHKNYSHSDIDITLKYKGNWEENKTWEEIYNLKSRYKDILVNKSFGKTWLVDFIDTYDDKMRENELEKIEKLKNTGQKFGPEMLRSPFLLACRDSGLI